jgi:hypothetical protein
MSVGAVARRAALLAGAAFLCVAPVLANDAAHQMAEKFATPDRGAAKKAESPAAAPAKAAEPAAKVDEAAKKEAERQAAEARKREAARKAAEAKRRAEAAAAKATADAARRADGDARRREEAEMLARARREAEELKTVDEEALIAEEARKVIEQAERERLRAEELLARHRPREAPPKATAEQAPPRIEEPVRPAAEPTPPPAAADETAAARETERLAQERAEETKRLAEKLRRVRQIREARLAAQKQAKLKEMERHEAERQEVARKEAEQKEAEQKEAAAKAAEAKEAERRNAAAAPPPSQLPAEPATPSSPTVAAAPPAPALEPPSGLGAPKEPVASAPRNPAPAAAVMEPRVTVLILMSPGNRGIRRSNKLADPLLCVSDGCYVSAGADTPAIFLRGRKALGIGNTLGGRAGACRNQLGCVFRGIPVDGTDTYLQPIDMRLVRHDRRQPQMISADSACRVDAGRLACWRGITAEDYTMWIVPESVATAAGPSLLERAVADGLIGPRSAELQPRR